MNAIDDLVISPNGFGFRSDTGEVFQLNATASEVIRWLQAGESSDEVARKLADDHGVPLRRARCDVATFLEHLESLDLIKSNEL